MKKKARLLSCTAQVLLAVKENAKIEVESYLNSNFPSWEILPAPPNTNNFLILEVGDNEVYIQPKKVVVLTEEELSEIKKSVIKKTRTRHEVKKKTLILIDTKEDDLEKKEKVFSSANIANACQKCIDYIKEVTGEDYKISSLRQVCNGGRLIKNRFLVYDAPVE